MTWIGVFKHLLPKGKAWRLTSNKPLRQFFEGLSAAVGPPIKLFFDQIWQDIFPETTRDIASWEDQWGIVSAGLTEQERRDRLSAVWKAFGGQSPRYIQDTLRGHGFDVYVHEWWVPGSEPSPGTKQCVTPRSPLVYLRREFTGKQLGVECNEPLAQCGEFFAEAGNGYEPRGYPLVNRILQTVPDLITLCGEEAMEAGEETALCGNYNDFVTEYQNYIVPSNPDKWPYFLYIGAEDITDIAQIPSNRREEFEKLCLKICPAQQWLGILVEYQ